MKTLNDANFNGKRVLIRVDFNVPMNDDKVITDKTRILETLPTIRKIMQEGGIPVLMSHLGRHKAQVNSKYSLSPVAECLSELLKVKVEFWKDYLSAVAVEKSKHLMKGQIV